MLYNLPIVRDLSVTKQSETFLMTFLKGTSFGTALIVGYLSCCSKPNIHDKGNDRSFSSMCHS